ncbi:MAG TPA: AAA family ATPase, partial [Gemmatimonadaceae bacterium]|nr:AAA family ATPase [Gemmatimonadaceae bacterium]
KLDREKAQSALIFNPFLNGGEMLAALLTEFGVSVPANGTRKDLLDRLNQFLLAQLALGKSCVAIFDEAQHLSAEFLEQIRVLSNLETDQEKLIQIVLVGQPELLDKIRTPQMSQLDQRVSIRCMLGDLDEQETDRYMHHRLNVAGGRGQVRFSPKAVAEIYRASHGVPRLINLICDRALLAGFAAQTRDIQPEHVRKAVAALRGEDAEVSANMNRAHRRWGRKAAIIGAVAVVAAVTAGVALWPKLAATPDEALYWRATSAATATDAERDFRTLVARYPASKRFDDALLRLAQLELSRGDRATAIQHLTQLGEHAPEGINRTRALVLTSFARLDVGDTVTACQAITPELHATVVADTGVARQLDSVSALCATRMATAPTAVDSIARAAAQRDSGSTAAAKRGRAALVPRDSLNANRAKPPAVRPPDTTKP